MCRPRDIVFRPRGVCFILLVVCMSRVGVASGGAASTWGGRRRRADPCRWSRRSPLSPDKLSDS